MVGQMWYTDIVVREVTATAAVESAFVGDTDSCLRRTTTGSGILAVTELCNWTQGRVAAREQRVGGYMVSKPATAVDMRLRWK
jgi:hypothetical protein